TELHVDLPLRHQIAERLIDEVGVLHADVQRFEESDLSKKRVRPRLLEILVRALNGTEVPSVILDQRAANRTPKLETIERRYPRSSVLSLRKIVGGDEIL